MNPLQEVTPNEVDLDAILNSTDLDHDQLNDIVGHLKELERQPLKTSSVEVSSSLSALNGVPSTVAATAILKQSPLPASAIQNTSVSPNCINLIPSRLPSQSSAAAGNSAPDLAPTNVNGVSLNRSGINGNASTLTVSTSNLPASVSLTGGSDCRTSLMLSCASSMTNIASNIVTMLTQTAGSASVGLRPASTLVPASPLQLVNVVRSQDGGSNPKAFLPQQRAVMLPSVGTNQAPMRFSVQPQQIQRVII